MGLQIFCACRNYPLTKKGGIKIQHRKNQVIDWPYWALNLIIIKKPCCENLLYWITNICFNQR